MSAESAPPTTPDGDVWKGLQAGTADVVRQLERENAQLRTALRTCIARAGWVDPVEACRLVIRTAEEALKDGY